MECLTRSSSGSSIPFSPLPSLSVPVSLPANSSESLAGYYSLASGVVNVLTPGKLPHSAIVSIVTEQLDLDWGTQPLQNGTQGATSEFLKWLAPAISAVFLGLLLALVVPVVGCCILCCRNRGHCGVKSRIYRKKNQNVKCFVYTNCLLLSSAMILAGASLGIVSVKHMSASLRQLEPIFNSTLNDISNYLNGGAKQVNFISGDQFTVFEAHVLNDLKYIGDWFEEAIGNNFQSEAIDVVSRASSFLATLYTIDNLTASGNVLIGQLRNVTSDLVSQVSTLEENIANLSDICSASSAGSACDFLTSTVFAASINYTNVGDVDFNEHIDLTAIEEQIENATDIFQDLAHFIDTEAETYKLSKKAEDELRRTHDTIQYDYLNEIHEIISKTTSDDGYIEEARSEALNALNYMETYEPYWYGVALMLVSMFFLMVSLFFVGSFCGSFGYSQVAQPHSRSSISHCGGNCILLGVIVAFVISPLLLVVTSVSYGLATAVLKTCNELRPPEYSILREVADDPSVWGGVTLVGVITRETFSTTVNLSIAQTLSECVQNEALWKVLDGDSVYSLDFDEAFDCDSFGVGGDSFLPFDGFNTEDIFPSLTDINGSYENVNFDEYENITNDTAILSFDLMELKDNLTTLQLFFNTTNDTVGLTLTSQILSEVDSIGILFSELKNIQMNSEVSLMEIQWLINSSRSQLIEFTGLLDSFLSAMPSVVNNATCDYINRLCGFAHDYIDYAEDAIKSDLGKCGALPVAYKVLYSITCENSLDGLNGYWLSVGWCMLFSIPAVVLGLVLSDYFRRVGTRVVRFTDATPTSCESTSLVLCNDDEDVSMIHMSSKQQTHVSNTNSLLEDQQPLHTTSMDLEW